MWMKNLRTLSGYVLWRQGRLWKATGVIKKSAKSKKRWKWRWDPTTSQINTKETKRDFSPLCVTTALNWFEMLVNAQYGTSSKFLKWIFVKKSYLGVGPRHSGWGVRQAKGVRSLAWSAWCECPKYPSTDVNIDLLSALYSISSLVHHKLSEGINLPNLTFCISKLGWRKRSRRRLRSRCMDVCSHTTEWIDRFPDVFNNPF